MSKLDDTYSTKDQDILNNLGSFLKFYITVFRKLVLICYILLNASIHGLEIESNRVEYHWMAARVIEIILLFFILADILFWQIRILKFVI